MERAKFGDGVSSHNFRHTDAPHLIVGLKLEAVTVARLLGHSKPSTTQDIYAREFAKVKHDDEMRERLSVGYGMVLGRINEMSTTAGNTGQLRGPGKVGNIAI